MKGLCSPSSADHVCMHGCSFLHVLGSSGSRVWSGLVCMCAKVNSKAKQISSCHCAADRVTLVEANEVLGTFDVRLREYAAKKLHKAGVHLMQVRFADPPPPIPLSTCCYEAAMHCKSDMLCSRCIVSAPGCAHGAELLLSSCTICKAQEEQQGAQAVLEENGCCHCLTPYVA